MFRIRFCFITLVALLWATSFSTSYAEKEQSISEQSLRSSLVLVEQLLTQSSLAERVRTAKLPEATKSLSQALSIYTKALGYLASGELNQAVIARSEVMRLLMIAGRLANNTPAYVSKKPSIDYQKKLKSIDALLSAHKRITDDNKDYSKQSLLEESIDPLLLEAGQSAAKKSFKDAMVSLSKAYVLIAESIKSQRDGLSLVRSLDFATFKEAFDYEISKYEHYKMLVNMLINDRELIKIDKESKPFFDRAKSYYDQGVLLASKGEHKQAIGFIEKASKTLVKLIQHSGVYIPGA
ncbi:MAG: hypothetical protein ISEC1_P1708 [Thiomicrorhabdus sp.]|nr:MAG: hypothetical protein ISEC1_P1708 [Thiomicrorhabdus sp.]